MEENLNENLANQPDQSKFNYDTKAKKRNDVLIGFLGGLVAGLLVGGILSAIESSAGWLIVIFYIIAIIYFFNKGRKYIAIGLIVLCLVPVIIGLVVLGGCALGLIGLGGMH